jgi:hypothetical protein
MKLRQRITFTLLEDLHSGTGVGNAAVDALVARDREGRPCLFWSHLKGVLRDNAALLKAHDVITHSAEDLFGRPNAETGGAITLTSAWATSHIDTLAHTGVARRIGSRAALDDSLRVIEFVPAGSQFTAWVEMPQNKLDDFKRADDFKRIVAATDCLGADRRRGDGLVHIALNPIAIGAQTHEVKAGQNLRLLLRALDPISMPNTADPSSSRILGESFIRGQTLSGAIAAACFDTHNAVSKAIFDRKLQVGDALPLPIADETELGDLGHIQVLPAPRHFKLEKAPSSDDPLPWWSNGLSMPLRAGKTWRHEDALIWRQPGSDWLWYQPRTRQRLRIQVPGVGNELEIGEPELFAQHEIVERTLFIADLGIPNDPDIAANLQEWISTGSWLRVGRGGRPVEIVASLAMDMPASCCDDADASSSKRYFLLASDLILRDDETLETLPWLQPNQSGKLAAALGAALVDLPQTLRGRDIHGFNGVSRLPRQPEYALARGGVFAAVGAVPPFAGERIHEGFGRILPLPAALEQQDDSLDAEPRYIPAFHAEPATADAADDEAQACTAHGIFLNLKADLAKVSRSSRSALRAAVVRQSDHQTVLGIIRDYAAPGTRRARLDVLGEALKLHAEKNSGAQLADLAVWILDWSLAHDRDGDAQ